MMRLSAAAERPQPVKKPEGGYCLISVVQLCMAWWAYKRRLIKFRDLRCYFALHEMKARRLGLERGRTPEFGPDELRGLVGGVGGEHLRKSVQRLNAAGLGAFSKKALVFDVSPDRMPADDLSTFWEVVQAVQNNKRRVPVPRRTLRLLAETGRPVVVATILGHVLRCVYVRGGGVVSDGSCKASWISETFRVDARNVKAARKHLAGIGWLAQVESSHWRRQRWGGRAVVNLAWKRPDSYERAETKLPPQTALSTTVSPPPESDRNLPTGTKNQKPALAAGRPSGSFKKGVGGIKKPNIRDVTVSDLKDTGRLLVLFDQACRLGLADEHDAGRLRFVTAAEHALVKGTDNPPGLFIDLLKKKRWHYCTNDDEDAANLRLKRYLHGNVWKRDPVAEEPLPKPVTVPISDDAKLVSVVRRVVETRRLHGDPFYLLKRERPEWTRERWDLAVRELETTRFRWMQLNASVANSHASG